MKLKKAAEYIKYFGIKFFLLRLYQSSFVKYIEPKFYPKRYNLYEGNEESDIITFPYFSIVVPVYKTPEIFLTEMIKSVLSQSYKNFELCIADGSDTVTNIKEIIEEFSDCRIKYKNLSENRGISENTNEAIKMVSGDYIVFLDHDDVLEKRALEEVAKVIKQDLSVDVLYTDEDKLVSGELREPYYKPDFNIDLLTTNNYICHLLVVKKEIVDKVGGFRKEYDGAQDFDFILRCTEVASQVIHIPKVLYHWRTHENSTAQNPRSKRYAYTAGKRAIEAHFNRLQLSVEVKNLYYDGFYSTQYHIEDNPIVSIVIIAHNANNIKKCVENICKKINYLHYELLIVMSEGVEAKAKTTIRRIQKKNRCKIIMIKDRISDAESCNIAAEEAEGSILLFLDENIRSISRDGFKNMLGYFQRGDVCAVGGKIYTRKQRIYHAGYKINTQDETIKRLYKGCPRTYSCAFHRESLQQNVDAVSSKCMMVSRRKFIENGKFVVDSKNFPYDIDFCLRISAAGGLVVYNPTSEFYIK